jgi:hypothetical protein
MTLRGRFGITRSHRKVSEKVLGNIRKVPKTPETFQTFIEVVSVKELCQGLD